MKKYRTLVLALAALLPFASHGGDADLVLRNGAILTMDPALPRASALAIRGERIVAVGGDGEMDRHVGPGTRQLDLKGRTVIPGLIDTHIHAIRGGQTYAFETYWYDAPSLAEALDRLSRDAARRPRDRWVAVVGSWHPRQFQERRAPARADLDRAAPAHPAYVQYLYDYALLNTRGIEVLGLDDARPAELPGITVERDAQGRATGRLHGGIGPFNALFARLSRDVDRQASLREFLRAMNARGLTGFIDPSAGGPEAYEPLFALRDRGELTLRAGYRISALRSGGEAEWFRNVMAFRPPRHDDGQIAFLGLGENLVTAMNDGVRMGPGFAPPEAARQELLRVAAYAAERRIPLEIHAYTDDAADAILDAFERVAEQHDLRPLRWSIAHLNTGSRRTLERMARLGLAYTVQMGPYFEGEAIGQANSQALAEVSPPVRAALDLDLRVAGGTDSTRIGVAGVWQAIQYHVQGRAIGGMVQREPGALLTREEALDLYTRQAAWLAFDEDDRGQLNVGKLADLAVLDQPYLSMPVDRIHTVDSVLTLLGGKPVHDTGALSAPAR
ncbi:MULTISPECIES: amidohydrolase [Achromobacter]|uniref:Amidohydrolase n=1 Tax=Achromobacter denitrificans TaxID=32002 RepID=A0A6J5HN40_ACHDE|nr:MULTISPECIES: amidohydrolase [Achromobacter]QKQ47647.1 amidohydrolase [Achromobacter denitrificans]CAB3850733.1 N-substituted formamide deformylase [Achromobacter denitrificans]